MNSHKKKKLQDLGQKTKFFKDIKRFLPALYRDRPSAAPLDLTVLYTRRFDFEDHLAAMLGSYIKRSKKNGGLSHHASPHAIIST
jgi:hypothetical protein